MLRMIRVGSFFGLLGAGVLVTGCPRLGTPPADQPGATYELAGARFTLEPVVEQLTVPWDLAIAPDGATLFFTERPGRLTAWDLGAGAVLGTLDVDAVHVPGLEMGLMGLALSPDYEDDRLVYIAYTTNADGNLQNVVERYRFDGAGFTAADAAPIVAGIPAAFIHDGLRLEFGPDGKLYATTGDAATAGDAQDVEVLAGKVLRLNPDGTIPADNPIAGSPVFTLGHRNPQGIAFHPTRPTWLLATEHGDNAGDEVNWLIAGENYGWPVIQRDQTAAGLRAPLVQSGSDTWAPTGATFVDGGPFPTWDGAFVFAGLRGQSLFVLQLTPGTADEPRVDSLERGLEGVLGRLRVVRQAPDGAIYVATSNRDGRGEPGPNDDRILRLAPVTP